VPRENAINIFSSFPSQTIILIYADGGVEILVPDTNLPNKKIISVLQKADKACTV